MTQQLVNEYKAIKADYADSIGKYTIENRDLMDPVR